MAVKARSQLMRKAREREHVFACQALPHCRLCVFTGPLSYLRAAALFLQRIPRRLRCAAAFYTSKFFLPVIFIIHKGVVLRLITGELLHYGRSRARINCG